MSVQNDIHIRLAELAHDNVGEEVNVVPADVARGMDIPAAQASKTFFNLNVHGKIEIIRGSNGRNIIGYKLLAMPGRAKPGQRTPRRLDRERQVEPVRVEPTMSSTRRRSILTPHLDSYADQRHQFQRLSQDMGDLITATFNANDYAEEGLACLGRLRSIEDQYVAVRRQVDEQDRDLRALRAQLAEKLTIKANAAGVTIKHGD